MHEPGRCTAHLEGHAVCQQHGMPYINGHAMSTHGLLDLSHDDGAGSFNAQELPGLYDVIGVSLDALHPACAQNLLQICALHQQLVPA